MKNLIRFILPALVAAFLTACTSQPEPEPFTVEMLPGECWWGAFDNPSAWKISEAGGTYAFPMMQFSVAPWRILSKENLEICRKAAWLHAELGPYLLEQARAGSVSGEPIIRPMDYAFPGEGFEGCADQYMLGEKYLVAPMQTPGTERSVKLPQGTWKDETGRIYEGGRTYTIEVPLDRIPIFTES